MSDAIKNFIKSESKNYSAGAFGKAFVAFDIHNLVTAENKVGAIFTTLKNVVSMRAGLYGLFAGLFGMMSSGVKNMIRDTGALEAALKRVAQVEGLSKMFEPLIGGAEAAKKKIEELARFAESRKISLGDVASAERSMMIFTRGAKSAMGAMDEFADAAAATGMSVADVSAKFGEFYATMRGGGSIEGITEQMREMGMVSQGTADMLVKMQQEGKGTEATYTALQESMKGFKGAADEASKSLEHIEQAFEKAKTKLAEKVGTPFSRDEAKNTENYTEAVKSVTPALEDLSKFFATLANGMGTLKSSFVAWITSFPVLNDLIAACVKGLGLLIAAVSVMGAYNLATWCIRAAFGIGAMGAAAASTTPLLTRLTFGLITTGQAAQVSAGAMWLWNQALSLPGISHAVTWMKATYAAAMQTQVGMKLAAVATRIFQSAAIASGIGVILAVVATAYGIYHQWAEGIEEARKEEEAFQEAAKQGNEAILAQIDAIKTLTNLHEALGAALDNEITAQLALNEARAGGSTSKIANREKQLKKAQEITNKVRTRGEGDLDLSAEKEAAIRNEVERKEALRQGKLSTDMDVASPRDKVALMRGEMKDKLDKAERAKDMEKYTIKTAADRGAADAGVIEARKKLEGLKEEEKQDKKRREKPGYHGVDIDRFLRDKKGNIKTDDKGNQKINPKFTEELERQKALGNKYGGINAMPSSLPSTAPEDINPQWQYKITKAKYDLEQATETQKNVGMSAPMQSSVRLRAEAKNAQTPYEKEKYTKEALEAEAIEGDRTKNETDAATLKAAITQLERQIAADEARVKIEKEIANIKETGFLRTEKEFELGMRLLAAAREEEAAKGKGASSVKMQEIANRETIARFEFDMAKKSHDLAVATANIEKAAAESKKTGYAREKEATEMELDAINKERDFLNSQAGPGDKKKMEALDKEADVIREKQSLVAGSPEMEDQAKADEYAAQLAEIAKKRAVAAKQGGGSPEALAALDAREANAKRAIKDKREGFAKGAYQEGLTQAGQRATLKGDSKTLTKIEDLSTFISKFEELKGAGQSEETAKAAATQFTKNSIALDARDTAFAANEAVSATSLARMGGGGNIGAGGADPMLTAAQRNNDLQETANGYLATIAGVKDGKIAIK